MTDQDSAPDLSVLVERADVLRRDAALNEHAARRNIERYVGTARVPVGLAGPLTICAEHARGIFHVPLATTEGTLVASTCRAGKIDGEDSLPPVRRSRETKPRQDILIS